MLSLYLVFKYTEGGSVSLQKDTKLPIQYTNRESIQYLIRQLTVDGEIFLTPILAYIGKICVMCTERQYFKNFVFAFIQEKKFHKIGMLQHVSKIPLQYRISSVSPKRASSNPSPAVFIVPLIH